jgi:hypothetical protein
LSGVEAVTSAQPPIADPYRTAAVALDRRGAASGVPSTLHYRHVEANYFQTLSIPVLLGRGFAPQGDRADQAVILSESAARDLWPGQNAIGHSVRLGMIAERRANVVQGLQRATELQANGAAYEVIGVVRDIRGVEFDGSGTKNVYLPQRTGRFDLYPILVRTRSDTAGIVRAFNPLLASIDSGLVGTAETLDDMLHESPPFIVSSVSAALASAVGLLGLLLAAMGIYGTVSYVVVHRTREIGIRMALGAQRRDVLALILRQSTRPVIAGVLSGLLLAVGASYLLQSLLYGLGTADGISFGGVSALLLSVATAAAYVPARRASNVDPNVALRYE